VNTLAPCLPEGSEKIPGPSVQNHNRLQGKPWSAQQHAGA
jgi:hypothetical protein